MQPLLLQTKKEKNGRMMLCAHNKFFVDVNFQVWIAHTAYPMLVK